MRVSEHLVSLDTQAGASTEVSRSLHLLLWGISIAIMLAVLLLTERRRSYVLPPDSIASQSLCSGNGFR